jgi:hypothetical protein
MAGSGRINVSREAETGMSSQTSIIRGPDGLRRRQRIAA